MRRALYMIHFKKPVFKRKKRNGQAMIEYFGALMVAAVIVAMLASGMETNNWLYNSYNDVFNASGNLLMDALEDL